jgi:hypothetical protein
VENVLEKVFDWLRSLEVRNEKKMFMSTEIIIITIVM